ncbi:AMP-binding protein [Sphingomonas sp. CBMAI 2297]|uniref:AMP-binding protein n=1 Tax=Sphingomonas sp. CBMAI 2297 TaxID=2991720 RepID=UPI0024580AAA|nr:AMP-binding protein [Sphingomonas sp. CBMAI 2297]MDH4746626.1 AMP-binding protein [Sphingomonas sp. CBMAI 2297]
MTHPDDEALLRDGFARARAHAFYRDHFAGIGDHRAAPATDKAVLKPHLDRFAPGSEPSGVYLVRSGGSTSTPLVFPVDIGENHAQRHALASALLAEGLFDARTVALNLFGYADLYRTAAILDDLLERCAATSLPMSAHARYEDVLATARRFTPTHLLGTPSKLRLFAEFLSATGERLEIPRLLYAGEPLPASAVERFAQSFGTRDFWSLYGGAETGIWAWSDASRKPGLFRILPQVVVEVVSPDSEGFGELAVTNGYRKRFPVFRYLVGDVGRLVERDGSRLLELRGRNARSFLLAEQHFDLPLFAPLAAGAEAFQIQLRQGEQGGDRLELLLVDPAGNCSTDAAAAGLAQLMCDVGSRVGLEVRRVTMAMLHHDPVTAKSPLIADLRH